VTEDVARRTEEPEGVSGAQPHAGESEAEETSAPPGGEPESAAAGPDTVPEDGAESPDTSELPPLDTDLADSDLKVDVSSDRMALRVSYPSIPKKFESFLHILRTELRKRHVAEEFLGVGLFQRVSEVVQNTLEEGNSRIEDAVVVEGVEPVPPVDGRIEWGGPFFDHGFVVDPETGAIDYRKRAAVTSVTVGQLLATVIPPIPGVNGRDIYGRMVPAPKGAVPAIRPGQHVEENPEERTFHAGIDGRIRWANSILSVDEVFVIDGNVDLKVGHISHLGAVVVEGDIEPDMVVKAKGDIEVHGIIDGADILTGGNLLVHGGITGKQGRKITVAGRVHARFILDAELEVGRDIVVEREVLQSVVKTRGALAMQYGRLVGGQVTALAGILVGQTGSEAHVRTHLNAGVDFRLQQKIERIYKQVDDLEERRTRIRETLEPVLKGKRPVSDKMKAAIEKIVKEDREIEKQQTELRIRIERLKMQSKAMAQGRVEVSKMMYPETWLNIQGEQLRVCERARGPLYATLVKGDILVRPGRFPTKKREEGPAGSE
jgi:hypothetical protein